MRFSRRITTLTLALLFFAANAFAASFLVKKVIDGDTFELANGEHVRLTGIDTPESRKNAKIYKDSKRTGKDVQTILAMGQESKQFVKSLVEGKEVELVFDVQKRDRYGRLLAYVFVPIEDERTNLNAYIIQQGYATPLTVAPNVKYAKTFERLFKEAQTSRRGLWSQEKQETSARNPLRDWFQDALKQISLR